MSETAAIMPPEPYQPREPRITRQWQDVRCPKCGRLLFRAAGLGTLVETKCRSCKATVTWPGMRADMTDNG